jgi:ABC-type branched-subunit amino acid transport system ATPase component
VSVAASGSGGAEVLQASGVLMQFGGLKALNNVDLTVRRGAIHGLIGPNGSGKSTMMNVLTGIYVPTAGNIEFGGRSLVGRTSADIALSGIARTFQNVQLFGEMTAQQNVQVGLHHTFKSNLFDVAVHTPRYRRESAAAANRALGLLKFVGLEEFAAEEARNLPYGKQRLLEIARALALDPQLLLLGARRRPHGAGHQGTDRHHPQDPRARRDGHPDRTPHGRGDEHVRHRLGARFRPEDRRGRAGQGPVGREGHRGLSRRAGRSGTGRAGRVRIIRC